MSQYDECVKENNQLKAQYKSEIIHLNGETEKKMFKLKKTVEKLKMKWLEKRKKVII